jgi:sterol desaturase/sphingolipid hydroxylase (fatty acid hydroxylase superfamily)
LERAESAETFRRSDFQSMQPWWFAHLGWLYGGMLVAVFLAVATLETHRPRRALGIPTGRRWLLNGFFLVLGDATTSLVFRVGAVALAFTLRKSGYGVLNLPWLPALHQALLTFLVLDFVQYLSHYLRHSVPLLWRLHQVHHSDRDIDLSTGVRFHPGEVLFTQGMQLLAIAATAPPPAVVACFELCNIVQALISHGNITLPQSLERTLGFVLVTPERHRIHHSKDAAHQRFNLAVLFSFWDRLFQTNRQNPRTGEDRLQFGIEEVTAAESVRPLTLLSLPFLPRVDSSGDDTV